MRLSSFLSLVLACSTIAPYVDSKAATEDNTQSNISSYCTDSSCESVLQGGALSGERYRVLISTDLPTDTDDIQSLSHYLLVADLFDLEGIISAPPTFMRTEEAIRKDCNAETKTACIHKVIDQYELDYPNLKSWSSQYPEPDAVRSLVKQGHDVSWKDSNEKMTEGSRWIVEQAQKSSDRPLYILVWGAITNTATALKHHPEIADNIRILMVGWSNINKDQMAYDFIKNNFPDVFFVEATGTMLGVKYPEDADGYDGQTLCETIRSKGALGKYWCNNRYEYVDQDFVTVYYLMAGNPEDPASEHWGGRYRQITGNRWADVTDPDMRMEIPGFGFMDGVRTSSKWRGPRMNHMMRMFDRTGHSEGSTKQNSFHEISLQSQHDYNIYADDFFLKVNWTLPDGSVRQSDGFYDGSRDYRARAYTHQVGQWSWRIESSIAEFNGLNGNFDVAESTLPGKLRKHRDDPFQFQYDNGDWFLHIGDTAYRYVNFSEPNWKSYLEQADDIGFTKIRTWFNHGRYDVQALFTEGREALNIPYWQEIDKRLRYAAENYPHIQFQVIPYGEDTVEIRRFGQYDNKALLIARYAQARFSAYPNVQWCLVNDREILQSGHPEKDRQVLASTINLMGKTMAAREPWGTLMTSHQARFEGYSFVDSSWSDIITLEHLDEVDGEMIRAYREISKDDPVILDEDRYEMYRGPKYPQYFFRRLFWANLFAGGHATYGGLASYEAYNKDNDTKGIQPYYDSHNGSFPLKGADHFQYIHQFFKDTGMTLVGFKPAQNLLDVTSDRITVASDGQRVLLYLSNPKSGDVGSTGYRNQPISLKLSLPHGEQARLSWFNPRNGQWIEGTQITSNRVTLKTPEGGDWVALIRP